jgi:hypothetical protein
MRAGGWLAQLCRSVVGSRPLPCQLCSAAKFNGVHSIDLYFPSNFGADHTCITFIGLRGEFSERRRQAVEAVYEARPVPRDHRVPGDMQGAGWNVGM